MTSAFADREIEVRFLDIDAATLLEKLAGLRAEDRGEDFLDEIIFYDRELKWQYAEKKFVRLRKTKNGVRLTFKHNQAETAEGTQEIEVSVGDLETTQRLLEAIGLIAFRHQQKKRRTFTLDGVIIDIDTWPKIPTYVEFEGPSEAALKKLAAKLGFDWGNAVFESARFIIEKRYGIPVSKLRYFTFDRVE